MAADWPYQLAFATDARSQTEPMKPKLKPETTFGELPVGDATTMPDDLGESSSNPKNNDVVDGPRRFHFRLDDSQCEAYLHLLVAAGAFCVGACANDGPTPEEVQQQFQRGVTGQGQLTPEIDRTNQRFYRAQGGDGN